MQMVDLLHADVPCSGIVWTKKDDPRVKNPEPRICGVVDENVPFPLLRAVLRTAPGSTELTDIWNRLMKYGDGNEDCGLYVLSHREHACLSYPCPSEIYLDEARMGPVYEAFDAVSTSVIGKKCMFPHLITPETLDLSSIVTHTDATELVKKLNVNLAKVRLYYANRYSILFGGFNLIFEKLDMSTATVGERVAKCIFADVLAKRIHKRSRSYGWYVLKHYFMPIWRLRNWLWKTTVAKKYAPGSVGFLEDRHAAAMFVDEDAALAVEYDEIDAEFDRIFRKRARERASDDPATDHDAKRSPRRSTLRFVGGTVDLILM